MMERRVGLRFLLQGTTTGKLSTMTLIAIAAITVAVWAMVTFLSVMYGFEASLRDRVLTAYPHVVIRRTVGGKIIQEWKDLSLQLENLKGLSRAMPYLETEMIVQAPRRTLGGVVWGIREKDFGQLQKGVMEGRLPRLESDFPEVLMGSELALRLGLEVGEEFRLVSPIEKAGPLGTMPRSQVFKLVGYYTSGHYDFDQAYLYLLMEDAQDLTRARGITGWNLWAPDIDGAEILRSEAQKHLPEGLEAQSWRQFNSALFRSLELEQYSMSVILTFAVVIAVMNVLITLIMHVTQKQRNVGILRALGASSAQVRRIFMWQGIFLGGMGLVLGAVSTALTMVYLKYFSSYLLPDIYYDRSVPIEIRPGAIFVIYCVAILLIYLSTLYPSYRAGKITPMEAIRS